MLTQQRQLIDKVFEEANRPISRDEVLAMGRKWMISLGSATVDRAIRKMCENSELVGLSFPGQPSRYELPAEKEHPHFICRACEKVFDLDIPMRLPSVNLPEGFDVSGGEVVYSGTCPECKDKAV
ncbi:MAG: Fur family transcriptional regulator [Coraliomargaritaceae bacterium]